MSPRTLLLCAVFLASAAAARAATADPCAKADELTTRDQILAAVPADDESWDRALRGRGIEKSKEDSSGWTQRFNGGSATASNRAFAAAFGDYCTAKARAASAPKPAARPAPAPPAAAPQPPRRVEEQTAKAAETNTGLLKKASAFFGGMTTAAPAEPTEVSSCDKSLCSQAATCRDAGMDGSGNLPTEFKCRRALSATKGSCCE